ncbi:hypothetical protein [Neisseria wadsworthii]|uniref:Major facilitator superfamily transporter MFS_1 n=1 Tax=Neisseria wadsworthii 9715 TaxID=1030841 RepID=G4CP57_9NEIS|nr:hypothetical protein [Neisseria wadsworthii]EGZ48571.1 major facilitator superfamily transporter MFS_1 [Neisseria wadsworthii 9715]QMT34693.1 MFS transporter [Neisseria wadsworthii]
MNVNKVWFYIALLSIIVAGVWLSAPDEAAQQRMKEAVAQKKAAQKQKQQEAASAAQGESGK